MSLAGGPWEDDGKDQIPRKSPLLVGFDAVEARILIMKDRKDDNFCS